MPEETGKPAASGQIVRRPGPWWWLGQWLLTGIACFFIFFGISLLVASYRLGNPFSFIMTFFAASLIILISVVMAMGFVVRMHGVRQIERRKNDDETDA